MSARLAKESPEQRAIDAGQIDAILDHTSGNVILLPAARQALLAKASLGNTLLAILPRAEQQRVLAGLERTSLQFGEVLQELGAPLRDVYFPVDCVVSLRAGTDARHALEVGIVGDEGMVGISLALGTDVASARAVVLAAGTALRMTAERFREALALCPALQRGLGRYADAKLAMARQAVACNSFHPVEARLARCLLAIGDRVRSEQFLLTQSALAGMLGVRRATVNEAVGPLQEQRLIDWGRGRIRIVDRIGLEAASCLCYKRIAHPPSRT